MPTTDGFKATERIRQWENKTHQPHLSIVALTAVVFAEDRQHSIASGMDDFLSKPIGMTDSATVLAKWMGKKAKDEKNLVEGAVYPFV